MKNILFAACVTVMVISSCTQDEMLSSENGKEPNKAHSRLTLVGGLSPQTRISIGDKTNDAYPLLWSEGDALGVFSRTEGANINNVQSLLSDESIGQNSGIFTSNEVSIAEEGTTELLIYYPYQQNTTLAEEGNQITSSLSSEQEQSTPGDSRHIGKYGFAYAKATVSSSNMFAKFTLKHTMAYVKFTISSKEFSAYKLKSVSLYDKETQTPLSGTFTADLDKDELAFGTGKKPYATVSLTKPETLSSAQDVYLTTYPADLTDKEVYIVITLENDLQTVTIPILKEGKQLKANAVNVITINDLKLSDNSCDWYEPVETRLLAGGWAYGESNCIMTNISTSGINNTISVKARGNFMEVEEPKYAKTILNCDLNVNHKMVGVNGLTTDISPVASDYTITVNAFKVSGGYDGGCGQVAIYGDDQTTVLWSFIVWMTPPPAEQAYGNTGYVVLDRNLGTYMTGEGNNWKANGVYFQWGRPTPIGWSGSVGTNIPTQATNVRFSIENPRALLYTNEVENTKSDWYLGAWTGARTDRKDDFWGNSNESNTYLNPSDGHKSIYDPCPKGYRVVSPRVLDEIEQKGELVNLSSIAVLKYCYDGTNYAYWPLAGCKWGSNGGNSGNNSGLDKSKGAACYWSNSSASSYGNDIDQGATSLYYKVIDKTWTHSSGRSHAFSVRCMKDTENR
ncbi:fimbrillin family protein [Bacteroidaceae bacterium HV4-6-C5C]|jgi:hypothetical protein|nr:fimbrillin family protein [Bacteroidaceae bacterium HV4-6-C5C]